MESGNLKKIETIIHKVFTSLGYKILVVQFPNYDPFGGYASEICFASVNGEKREKVEELNLIIKRNRVGIPGELFDDHLYTNEINFYERFEPMLRNFALKRNVEPLKNLPTLYGTSSEDEHHVIILKNLKLEGYKCHEIKKVFDSKHIRLVLKAYANWAAINLALADQEPEQFDTFKKNLPFSEDFLEKYITTFLKGVSDFIDICKEKGRSDLVEKLEEFRDRLREEIGNCMTVKDEPYQILRHGDCWNNNYLFRYNGVDNDPEDTVIIDWQCAILGSPLADVCYFLFFCCSRAELENIDDLLKYYYDILSDKMKKLGSNPSIVFPWEVFMEAFRKHTPCGLSGTPGAMKMRYLKNLSKSLDMEKIESEGDFSSILDGELRDPDEYFREVCGVFELCMERRLI